MHRDAIGREPRRRARQPDQNPANLCRYLPNRMDTRGLHEALFLGGQAQLQANTLSARSHQPSQMRQNRLVDWVFCALRRRWTLEEISARFPVEFPMTRAAGGRGDPLRVDLLTATARPPAIEVPAARAGETPEEPRRESPFRTNQIAHFDSLPACRSLRPGPLWPLGIGQCSRNAGH